FVVAQARQDPLPPREDELRDVAAVVLVDAFAELAPEGDPLVGVEVGVAREDVPALVDRRVRRDERADAAAGELDVPVDPDVGAGAVVVVEAAADGRAQDPVLEHQAAEPERLEDRAAAGWRVVRLHSPPNLRPSPGTVKRPAGHRPGRGAEWARGMET